MALLYHCRMRYQEQPDGSAQALIAGPQGFAVPLETASVAAARLDADLAAAVRRPFDLTKGPLITAKLWDSRGGTSTLLILMHHSVGDAWSQVRKGEREHGTCMGAGVVSSSYQFD